MDYISDLDKEMVEKKMKWRVTWWIHASGKLNGGSDVIEAAEDFDRDIAEDLIENDLERNLPSPLTKYSFPSPFEPNLPNFHKKHRDLSDAARHSEISNWGIRLVKPCKETRR